MIGPRLFSDVGCPYAHRVLALLAHLDVPVERVEAEHGSPLPGLAAHSPSGRIPLLVHGPLVLGESRVMLEYLAEAFGFAGGLPSDPGKRALHREAMALFDAHLAPPLFRTVATDAARLAEVLDALERLATDDTPSLLGFHVGPFWRRLLGWRPNSEATLAIQSRPALRAWLDAIAAWPSVSQTDSDPRGLAALLASLP